VPVTAIGIRSRGIPVGTHLRRGEGTACRGGERGLHCEGG